MSKFEFESFEATPEDSYIKEIVYIKFVFGTDSFLVPYFRKAAKDGGLFWAVASVGVQKHGVKKYVDGFEHDSKILDRKIKEFLESRAWEKQQTPQPQAQYYPHGLTKHAPTSMKEVAADEQLPF